MTLRAKAIVGSAALLIGVAVHAPLTAQSLSPDLESLWAAAGFGAAIAIGDGEIFVGRTGGGIAGAIYPSPGSIYVFERGDDAAGEWNFAYIITVDDVEIGDEFGAALAVDGNRLLVGTPGSDGGRGGAHLFERAADGEWARTQMFSPPADGDVRGAGAAVALSSDAVFLGAPSDAGPGAVIRFPAGGGPAAHIDPPPPQVRIAPPPTVSARPCP